MRATLPLLVALALAGCARDLGEPDQTSDGAWRLDPNSFYTPTFETTGKAQVRVHVNVDEGNPIDAFLAAGAQCNTYPRSGFRPLDTLTATRNGTLEAEVPAGRACIVLDNNDTPYGEAPGTQAANVSWRIELWQ